MVSVVLAVIRLLAWFYGSHSTLSPQALAVPVGSFPSGARIDAKQMVYQGDNVGAASLLPFPQSTAENPIYYRAGFQGGYVEDAIMPPGTWFNREATYFTAIFPDSSAAQSAAAGDMMLLSDAEHCHTFTVHVPFAYASCAWDVTQPGNHVTKRYLSAAIGRVSILVMAYTGEIGPKPSAQTIADAATILRAVAARAQAAQA